MPSYFKNKSIYQMFSRTGYWWNCGTGCYVTINIDKVVEYLITEK